MRQTEQKKLDFEYIQSELLKQGENLRLAQEELNRERQIDEAQQQAREERQQAEVERLQTEKRELQEELWNMQTIVDRLKRDKFELTNEAERRL